MQVVHPHCAGLDVHKKTVVACVLHTQTDGTVTRARRTFGTTTHELLQLLDWLQEHACTHVALESTGVYWRPVYNLLEGHLEILLVNAQHVKHVPGRKTDVKDAEWLADLLRHGLLRASYVPAQPQRDLRELTRGRALLVADRARTSNRLQQALEGANLKVASVVSDIRGKSAREMLDAILAGESDPETLAALARGRLRKKQAALQAALDGRVRDHHRFVLAQLLTQLDFYDEQIATYDAEIEARIAALSADPPSEPPSEPHGPAGPAAPDARAGAPRRGWPPETPPTFAAALALMEPIPGLAARVSQAILAELGVDMHRFPTVGQATKWGGVAPGNYESAGKRLAGRTTPGNPALRKALIQAARGAIRTKDSFFQSLYHRLAPRRGKNRAVVAVARHLLVVIYHVLLYQEPYRELGGHYYDECRKETLAHQLVRRLERLGYRASVEPLPELQAT